MQSPEIEDFLSDRIPIKGKYRPEDIGKQNQEKILKGETIEEWEKDLGLSELLIQSSDKAFRESRSFYLYRETPTITDYSVNSSDFKKPRKLKSLFKEDSSFIETRGRPRKLENIQRRITVRNILVEEYGENFNPAELTPSVVYEILEERSRLRELYEPSDAPIYKRKYSDWKKASIKDQIRFDLRYLHPNPHLTPYQKEN